MTDQVNFGDELVSPEEKTRRVGSGLQFGGTAL